MAYKTTIKEIKRNEHVVVSCYDIAVIQLLDNPILYTIDKNGNTTKYYRLKERWLLAFGGNPLNYIDNKFNIEKARELKEKLNNFDFSLNLEQGKKALKEILKDI